MSKLRVAVVGCGAVAQKRHIPSFLRLRGKVSLCAICDLNQALATEVGKRFGVPHVYPNLSDMLSKEDLDIVDICTPPRVHSSVAIESMENKCNVLMEKPMALSVSECNRMISVAEKYGTKLSVVHNERFYPSFIKAQELVDEGVIGKLIGMRILSLTSRKVYMAHEDHWVHKLPGGVIGETGPHTIYLSLAFINTIKNVDVYARKTLSYPWVLYDDYRIELEGDSMNGSIYISHAGDYTATKVDLLGTESSIVVELESLLLTQAKLEDLKPTSVALSSLRVAAQIVKGVVSNTFKVIFRTPMLGHDIMIEKFVNSIINDEPVPVAPEEGRETVRVMEEIAKKLA